jgi:PiT family inorganic phosphate transporter
MGAGASRRLSAVRWGVAGNILLAWVMTIPCAALVGAAMELVTRLPGGDIVVFFLAALIAGTAFLGRRWQTRRFAAPPPQPAAARA